MPGLSRRYIAAVLAALGEPSSDPAQVPTALTRAAADTLGGPGSGAGLSRVHPLRVPLHTSTSDAGHAEELETTLNHGPCLTAAGTGQPVLANPTTLTRCWPLYADALRNGTPFRSVVSLPLLRPGHPRPDLTLDLYLTGTAPSPDLIQDQLCSQITTLVTVLLDNYLHHRSPRTREDASAGRRLNVWTAVGMLRGATHLDEGDSLAVLRGYAFTHDLTLDDLAAQLTSTRLAVDQIIVEHRN